MVTMINNYDSGWDNNCDENRYNNNGSMIYLRYFKMS